MSTQSPPSKSPRSAPGAGKSGLVFPILLITVGTGWLLTTHNVIPGVNWVWVLGLAVAGFLALAAAMDKVTIVVGPFLIMATFFSILRQTDRIAIDTEVPTLGIVAGVLMPLAYFLPVPPAISPGPYAARFPRAFGASMIGTP